MAKKSTSRSKKTLFVVSDSTGDVATLLARALINQFEHDGGVALHLVPAVRSVAEVTAVVRQAARVGGFVAYTIVNQTLWTAMREQTAARGLATTDFMTLHLAEVGQWLGKRPLGLTGAHHRLDGEYFRRMRAVEFTQDNDDGQRPTNFGSADIVILGVSRTSKTPVSHALAQKGYRVANWPLVTGVPLPLSIEKADPRRVFMLRMDPSVLLEVRRARLEHMGQRETDYVDPRAIRQEIQAADVLLTKYPRWTAINAARRAVEETAAEVIKYYTLRFGDPTI